jgi:hypothetical protein
MQVAALGDVAVDLDDARGRLVPRLHLHGLWLYGLDAVPHVLDKGIVAALAGVAGQLFGGAQGRELTEGRDGSGLVQLDDAHVVVDRESGEVVVVRMGIGRSRDVVGVRVQPSASGVVERFLRGVVGTGGQPASTSVSLKVTQTSVPPLVRGSPSGPSTTSPSGPMP